MRDEPAHRFGAVEVRGVFPDPGESAWSLLELKRRIELGRAVSRVGWDDIDVACPTLMMRGAESHVFPAHNMKRLQEMIPGSEAHNIDDCDHRISQDQPALMASLIDDFVKRRIGAP